MPTNRSNTESEEMLNHLLEAIVLNLGGTIEGGDKLSLLDAWLKAVEINNA